MQSKYKIYCLIDPRDGCPFYVGATKRTIESRLYSHINKLNRKSKRNSLSDQRKEKIKEILSMGIKPIISLIEEATEKEVGLLEEKHFYRLTNAGHVLLQSASCFTYNTYHYKKPEIISGMKINIPLTRDLHDLLMQQQEIKEYRIPRCKVLIALINEALNAREVKKNKK